MKNRLKLALAALLGFSAACSTVKNTPREPAGAPSGEQPAPEGGRRHAIRVMYGVPRPLSDSARRARIAEMEQIDPVAELPEPDTLTEAVGTRKR